MMVEPLLIKRAYGCLITIMFHGVAGARYLWSIKRSIINTKPSDRAIAPFATACFGPGDRDANDIPPIFGSMFGGGKASELHVMLRIDGRYSATEWSECLVVNLLCRVDSWTSTESHLPAQWCKEIKEQPIINELFWWFPMGVSLLDW